MMAQRTPPVEFVKLSQLLDYLTNSGWQKVPFARQQALKFRSPSQIDDEYIFLYVPSSETLRDYRRSVEDCIETISSFEDRPFEEVLSQLLTFSDCVKTQIVEARKGLILLDRGAILYKRLFDLIMSGGIFELDPSGKRPSRKERAKKCARSSLIGQSEYGSYIANIYIPLDRPHKDFDFSIDPFQRKVVLRILRGLKSLDESVTEESPEPIIKNYENGLNEDMCDALTGIIDAGMGDDVIMKAVLEPAYTPPKDILTEFTLTPQSKNYLKSAIVVLKERDKPPIKDGWWSGFPRVLDRPETAKRGMIKLETIDADEGHINIYIEFDEEDYKFCVDSNLNKKQIQIRGTLEKDGRRWVLHNPYDLAHIGGRSRSIVFNPKQESLKTYEKKKL